MVNQLHLMETTIMQEFMLKRSMNGFDMTGSLGYTISELDVEKGGSADSRHSLLRIC